MEEFSSSLDKLIVSFILRPLAAHFSSEGIPLTLDEMMSLLNIPLPSCRLFNRDSRDLSFIQDGSVHLVLTSPPYWTLKEYNRETVGQLGHIQEYSDFLDELNKVWRECFRILVPGSRLIIIVGDVLLSRKEHGRHRLVPLHADIQLACQKIGFDCLAPIIWYKIGSASYEGEMVGQDYP